MICLSEFIELYPQTMNCTVCKFKNKLIKLLYFQTSKSAQNLPFQAPTGLGFLYVLGGGRLTSCILSQVLTQTILPHFSFISLKKVSRKQNKDVEDKQYKKRRSGKIMFKMIM